MLQECFDQDYPDLQCSRDVSLEQVFGLDNADDVMSLEFSRNLHDANMSPATVVENLFNFCSDVTTSVTSKPPPAPKPDVTKSRRSSGSESLERSSNTSKSDMSSQSSPLTPTCHPHVACSTPRDHIYDEPVDVTSSSTVTSDVIMSPSFCENIERLNAEIANMRLQCKRIHASNKAQLGHAMRSQTTSSENSSNVGRIPRSVPRMGTKLDYLLYLQALQQHLRLCAFDTTNDVTSGVTATDSSDYQSIAGEDVTSSVNNNNCSDFTGCRDLTSASGYNTNENIIRKTSSNREVPP